MERTSTSVRTTVLSANPSVPRPEPDGKTYWYAPVAGVPEMPEARFS